MKKINCKEVVMGTIYTDRWQWQLSLQRCISSWCPSHASVSSISGLGIVLVEFCAVAACQRSR